MGPNHDLLVGARDIRRERTGIHADVGIFWLTDQPRLLGRDVFNIGRQEDLTRLCRSVHRRLPAPLKEAYPLENLELDLLYFCLWISREWELRQFEVVTYKHEEVPSPPSFALFPYILDGGGTIMFAPRESFKSYLCILMAMCIATGGDFWTVQKRPVLYVNLERDNKLMDKRDFAVTRALGAPTESIRWLSARGGNMEAAARQVHGIATPDTVVIYDSISRMGLGGLNEDQTANRSADLANWASPTWLAVGHTPRDDNSHLFGSVHFENAADILVRVTKDEPDGKTGVALQVVKANDFAKPAKEVLALEFDEIGLLSVRRSDYHEFPNLSGSGDQSSGDRVKAIQDYLRTIGAASGSEIADELGIPRHTVANILANKTDVFAVSRKEGHSVLYQVRSG